MAGIINWRKDELEAVDRKTSKILTKYNRPHSRADVDCLYIPKRKEGENCSSLKRPYIWRSTV